MAKLGLLELSAASYSCDCILRNNLALLPLHRQQFAAIPGSSNSARVAPPPAHARPYRKRDSTTTITRTYATRKRKRERENRRRERVVERLLDVESYLHDTIVKIYIYIIYNIHHLLYSSLYTIIPHHPHFIYISITYFTTLSYTHPRGEGGGLTSELLELPEHMNSSKYCKFCPYMP